MRRAVKVAVKVIGSMPDKGVPGMQVRVLGEVTLSGPDGPVVLERAGERILLAVLAIHAGQDIDAATLLRLLGDGGGEQIAVRTLTDYITAVRAALQKAGGSRTMLPDARRRRGTYRLDADLNLIDYQRFEQHTRAARSHASAGNHRAAAAQYRQALNEWKGQPLAGIDRAGIDGLRLNMQEQHRVATRALITQQLHIGEYGEAVQAVGRVIDETIADDDIVVLGLHALARAGRRADIPGFYAHATRRLQALLGEDAHFDPHVRQVADTLAKDPQKSLRLLPAGATGPGAPVPGGDTPTRFTLPPDTVVFTGRAEELAAITATAVTTVTKAAQTGGVVAIHAIDGMPGIGKTSLAIHAAHQFTHRYPDGHMFVDLHAYTPGLSPTDPADALADLLRADGVDPRHLPDTLDARTALWRDRMTGRHCLLIFDNAISTAQVAPLLPGSDTVLVLITSRRRLGDLRHATHLHLNVLPHHDAITMFTRLAPRGAEEPDAVAELVRMCQYLPLAIAILASRYAAHPVWTMTDLLAEFAAGRQRLLTIKSEDATVHAAFGLSYERLPPVRQRFFRLLGLTPGVDIDGYAAAALADTTVEDAAEHLDELYNDHLLDETAPRRYRMHDLIRAYTQRLTETTDPAEARHEASERLLDFYRYTAATAMDVAHPYERHHRPTVAAAGTPTPVLADRGQAERWLDTELVNLLAAADHAANHGQPQHTWQLSTILGRHLRTRGHYREAQALHQHAADLADQAGNQAAQMHALTGLGHVHWMLGDYDQAGGHYRRALRIAHTLAEPGGESNALNGLGEVHRRLGDYEQAADHHRRALSIAHTVGDRSGEMNALTGLADVAWQQGDYEQAGDHYRRALHVAQAIGDRSGEMNALTGLGYVHWLLDDHEQTDHYEQAIPVADTEGDRSGETNALIGSGDDVHRPPGRFEQASDHFERALSIAHAVGDRPGQVQTLIGLGHVHQLQGDHEQAGDHFGRALHIAQAIGDRRGELNSLTGLGHVRRMLGQHSQAADCYQQVLALAQQINNSNWQYEAWQSLGRLHHATGRPDLALTCHQQALQLATELTQPIDQARAHDGLAYAHHATGQHDPARQHWQHALDILASLGTDRTEDIEANIPTIRARLAKLNETSE